MRVKFLTDNLAHFNFLSGVSWVHTAQITRVRTAASVSIAWMVLFVSVNQVFKETGKSFDPSYEPMRLERITIYIM